MLSSLVAMGGVDAYRGPGIFDPEVTTAPDAPAHQRLSAYLGRDLTRDPGRDRAAVRVGA